MQSEGRAYLPCSDLQTWVHRLDFEGNLINEYDGRQIEVPSVIKKRKLVGDMSPEAENVDELL